MLGETSKFIGCSLHIQQPAAANLYRKCYTLLLDAESFWLQPAVMKFDVFPYGTNSVCYGQAHPKNYIRDRRRSIVGKGGGLRSWGQAPRYFWPNLDFVNV